MQRQWRGQDQPTWWLIQGMRCEAGVPCSRSPVSCSCERREPPSPNTERSTDSGDPAVLG